MKIFCGYKPVIDPWGGAHNFNRALLDALKRKGFILNFDDPGGADIFFNQLGKGAGNNGGHYSLSDIAKLKKISNKAPLVVRAINLNKHAYGSGIN